MTEHVPRYPCWIWSTCKELTRDLITSCWRSCCDEVHASGKMFRSRTPAWSCHRHWSAYREIQVSCNDHCFAGKWLQKKGSRLWWTSGVQGWLNCLMFVADLKDDTGRVTGRRQAARPSPPSPRYPSPNPPLETSASACLCLQSLGRGCEMLANLALSQSRTTMSQVILVAQCTFHFFGSFL